MLLVSKLSIALSDQIAYTVRSYVYCTTNPVLKYSSTVHTAHRISTLSVRDDTDVCLTRNTVVLD